MKLKAISLWEPWASLIKTGAKKFETRSWATNYRGPLVICAAKGGLAKRELLFELSCWSMQGGLAPLVGEPLDLTGKSWPGVKLEHLSFGKALCVVDLVDCIKTDDLALGQIGTDKPFGNFGLGRFAWKLENVRILEPPFEVKGKQGFFEVEIQESV